jgi:16S rRNA (adenine1518-N6/adenine1519-N6)-dimethyltransferase
MPAHSPLASPAATLAALKRWGLHTKKSLGQHFLISDNVVGRILALAELGKGDAVLEIGPGIGTLTEAMLLAGASVLAVEKDASLLPALEDLAGRYPGAFELINEDATKLVSDISCSKLVANLPYAVAATVVLDAFVNNVSLQSATVMVQREVAERMRAAPGTAAYGAYTVKLAALARPSGHFTVAPGNFLPPPRVDSCVIRLDRHTAAQQRPASSESLFTVADAAFYQRRKTIRNSVRAYLADKGADPLAADSILAASGIEPRSRGEQHGLEEFWKLAAAYEAVTL